MKGFWGALLAAFAAAALAACVQPGAGGDAGVEGTLSHDIYTRIMTHQGGYATVEANRKALAACVNWANTTRHHADVRYAFYYYESPHTERMISTSNLMQGALTGCNRGKDEAGLDCDCVAVDRNGSPVLRVPDTVAPETGAWSAPPGDGGSFDGAFGEPVDIVDRPAPRSRQSALQQAW